MNLPDPQWWQDRRVFVTGHTGFKGSWLCLWLNELGARVTGYSLSPPTKPSLFEAANVAEGLHAHRINDIRHYSDLAFELQQAQPEVIFHLAAQPLVRQSYQDPLETFSINVQGTIHVLEAIRETCQRKTAVVAITSDKCYANREQVWGYRECDALGGRDPYSASKGAAEIVIASYRDSFFRDIQSNGADVRLASVRAGNVIGGGDWAKDRIITDLVRCLTTEVPVPVRNPAAVRPWQHVLEPLNGYLQLAERLSGPDGQTYARAWNLGPQSGPKLTVQELVEIFIEVWGKGSWRDESRPDQPHEAQLLQLCIDQILQMTSWQPVWKDREAIQRTAAWFRRFSEGGLSVEEVRNLCLEDLHDFKYQAEINLGFDGQPEGGTP